MSKWVVCGIAELHQKPALATAMYRARCRTRRAGEVASQCLSLSLNSACFWLEPPNSTIIEMISCPSCFGYWLQYELLCLFFLPVAFYGHTSARSIGFCVIWVCISSSSSSRIERYSQGLVGLHSAQSDLFWRIHQNEALCYLLLFLCNWGV